MTMNQQLSHRLISDRAAVAKEGVHDGNFIKGWPTPPGSSLGELLYSPDNNLSKFQFTVAVSTQSHC